MHLIASDSSASPSATFVVFFPLESHHDRSNGDYLAWLGAVWGKSTKNCRRSAPDGHSDSVSHPLVTLPIALARRRRPPQALSIPAQPLEFGRGLPIFRHNYYSEHAILGTLSCALVARITAEFRWQHGIEPFPGRTNSDYAESAESASRAFDVVWMPLRRSSRYPSPLLTVASTWKRRISRPSRPNYAQCFELGERIVPWGIKILPKPCRTHPWSLQSMLLLPQGSQQSSRHSKYLVDGKLLRPGQPIGSGHLREQCP
ncbi:hypothetical protein K402DRAFT_214126 [Aulographum hederae CBS 113979]|uniref:Uncharacterized protein n=1 Tax=Aulographum hederae CBS 113979 TaxID=1176131 RepID=A0A6G1GMK9_9PEZI|nr:hypothetical protein K402DRAFT_214126 [Aulographum hederae CBS 113979]